MTLLLFGKGAVLARWLMRPLAIEMDETEQRPTRGAANPLGAHFHGCRRLRPHTAHAR